jgi:AcrR family transcriptional regulator
MSPRPYRLGLRQSSIDETRSRIVGAARELLAAPEGATAFTVEAVARRANVARMTVYYQFGSRAGLLEALYDDLAAEGLVPSMPAFFSIEDPRQALVELVRLFFGFWDSSRLVQRRARALAWLNADIEQGVRARDERRRQICRRVLERVVNATGRPGPSSLDETTAVLYTLTSFETFDLLSGETRTLEEVIPPVQTLVLATVGLT